MKRNGINKFEGHPGKLHWRRRQNVSFLLRLRFFFLFFFQVCFFTESSNSCVTPSFFLACTLPVAMPMNVSLVTWVLTQIMTMYYYYINNCDDND